MCVWRGVGLEGCGLSLSLSLRALPNPHTSTEQTLATGSGAFAHARSVLLGDGGAFRLLRSRFFVRAEFAERQVKGKDGEIKVSKGFSSLWPLVCLAACLNYRCSIANLFQLLPRCSCCGCFCVVCVCVCVCVCSLLCQTKKKVQALQNRSLQHSFVDDPKTVRSPLILHTLLL